MWSDAVALDFVEGPVSCAGRTEVGAIAGEGAGPLLACVRHGVGDEVRDVMRERHPDLSDAALHRLGNYFTYLVR